MDQMERALELLATKLGTTSEYLWGIMVKQAPISAMMNFIQYLLIIIGCIFWFKLTKIIKRKVDSKDLDSLNYVWIAIGWLILTALVVTAFFSFSNFFYALVHPEYWALDNILNRLPTTIK